MYPIKPKSTILIEQNETWNGELSDHQSEKLLQPLQESYFNVFQSVASIEMMIDEIILVHFFQRRTEENEASFRNFQGKILNSSWCTFASKKALLMEIVSETNLMGNKERGEFDKLLRDAMNHRNIFAHGLLSTDGIDLYVSFYQGKNQKVVISQDWLYKIESDLNNCFDSLEKIAKSTGAMI